MSYVMPIGIPNPGFGLDDVRPSRPDPWTSDIAGYYYVNNDTGTDTGRTYGNPTAPRATFPRPIPAGSYVEIHGTYDVSTSGSTFIQGSGTSATWAANSAGPVWVCGFDDDSRPTFTLPTVIYGSYVIVERILWTAQCQIGSGTAGRPVDHIVVRHCENAGDGIDTRSGFLCEGSSSDGVSYVVFYDNYVHDLGDLASPSDIDCLAFSLSRYVQNGWVLDCEWARIVGGARAGSGTIGADPAEAQWLYWGRNYIHDGKQNAITCKYGKNVVFSQNTIENITDNGGALSPGKGLAGQYKPDGLWMIFNRISLCRYGIYYASADAGGPWNQYLIGNVITECGTTGEHDGGATSEAAIMMRGGYTRYLVGNTAVDCDQFYGSNGASGDFHFLENNIFAFKTHTAGFHINIENSPDNCTVRNCVLYDSGGTEIRWGGASYSTLAAFQSGESNGVGCFGTDPLFADKDAGDYALTDASPGLDSGLGEASLSVNVYALYESTFGVSILKDFNGYPIPSSAPDIGAIQENETLLNVTTLNAITLTIG